MRTRLRKRLSYLCRIDPAVEFRVAERQGILRRVNHWRVARRYSKRLVAEMVMHVPGMDYVRLEISHGASHATDNGWVKDRERRAKPRVIVRLQLIDEGSVLRRSPCFPLAGRQDSHLVTLLPKLASQIGNHHFAPASSAKGIGHEQNAHYRLAEDSRRQQSALVAMRTANIIATYVLAAATAPAVRMSTKASGSPISSTTM